ncbi:PIR Superfamily Protein [Plasmodium ovale wallikeri]|uniref:PIR Superfamily Protein n=1 Tax=Plasmodium ovale wallikeri TaxID=864142 RepID=A0A1A9AMJ5_PLAOA|nr:PIR Superfamily Protein [Plasmodium ovale wallikeri]
MSSQKRFSNSSKELFSEKFYEAMNIDSSDLSKYDHECNEIIAYNPKDVMIKICKNYLRYIEYCKLLNDDNSLYKDSVFFNYWLYGVLTHIYGFNSTEQIRTRFSALQNIDDKCDYYKKIVEKKGLYEHFDKQCLLENYICPDFYDKCMLYKPDNVLSKLPCHQKIAQEQADAKAAERPDTMKHTSASGPGTEVCPIGHVAPRLPTIGHSVLAVAPFLLTATALYRYTPVGSWFRKLGGYNQSGISDMDKFSFYTQKSDDMFSDSEVNYISYQPI